MQTGLVEKCLDVCTYRHLSQWSVKSYTTVTQAIILPRVLYDLQTELESVQTCVIVSGCTSTYTCVWSTLT